MALKWSEMFGTQLADKHVRKQVCQGVVRNVIFRHLEHSRPTLKQENECETSLSTSDFTHHFRLGVWNTTKGQGSKKACVSVVVRNVFFWAFGKQPVDIEVCKCVCRRLEHNQLTEN